MKTRRRSHMGVAMGAWFTLILAGTASGGELDWDGLAKLVGGGHAEIPCPQSCDRCDKEFCIQRVPIQKCVTGKKEVFDCKIRYEYVSIPEVKYRWVNRWVTKEIPCPYCMPTCEEKEVEHCVEGERWREYPAGCAELHCKTCEGQVEKLPCKHCGRKPGETTVKVRYRSCVKEPYVVYRQVKRPICLKKPRYEKVTVPITKYECKKCGGAGCDTCCSDPDCHAGGCSAGACDAAAGPSCP